MSYTQVFFFWWGGGGGGFYGSILNFEFTEVRLEIPQLRLFGYVYFCRLCEK